MFPATLGFLNSVALVTFKLSLTDILCIFTSTMSSLKAELLATKKEHPIFCRVDSRFRGQTILLLREDLSRAVELRKNIGESTSVLWYKMSTFHHCLTWRASAHKEQQHGKELKHQEIIRHLFLADLCFQWKYKDHTHIHTGMDRWTNFLYYREKYALHLITIYSWESNWHTCIIEKKVGRFISRFIVTTSFKIQDILSDFG